MDKLNISQIDLPIVRDENKRRIVETLPVEQIAANRFKLTHSPVMVEGLAAGDELELSDATKFGYKVLKRGGNLCVWFFFGRTDMSKWPSSQEMISIAELILIRPLAELGGYLDGGGAGSLVFTIPITAGFSKIEFLFDNAQQQIPGSTWMYGNVYDPEDGQTPLNWWK